MLPINIKEPLRYKGMYSKKVGETEGSHNDLLNISENRKVTSE
jgi:hypothetical protein